MVFSRSPWAADLGSAMTALTWSLMFTLAPKDMTDWESMRLLETLATQDAWQAMAMVLSVVQLVATIMNYRWLRWGAALVAAWFWGVLTLGVWSATPWNPAVAAYAGWCGINLFSILRLLRPDRMR